MREQLRTRAEIAIAVCEQDNGDAGFEVADVNGTCIAGVFGYATPIVTIVHLPAIP